MFTTQHHNHERYNNNHHACNENHNAEHNRIMKSHTSTCITHTHSRCSEQDLDMYTYIRVDQKVRIHTECLLTQQIFIQNNISHEKTEQRPTFPHSHPEGSGICQSISVNVAFSIEFCALQAEPL
jgi:hypothetical protein